jgi:peptide/nickel transport system permease protein
MTRRQLRYAGGKVGRLVAALLVVTFLATALMDLIPGSPAIYIAGDGATPAMLQAINQQYGFNDPLFVRYGHWLLNVVHGNLGTSSITGSPVIQLIAQRLPVTLELIVLASALSLLIAVPLAIACARRPDSRFDRIVTAVTFGQVSIPVFLTALLLVFVFAVKLGWLPALGWTSLTADPLQNLKSVILPIIAIASGEVVALYRVLRADLIATMQEDYIALAGAKRLTARRIMWVHALKPSSFSLVTLTGVQLAQLFVGTVIVEQIFDLPGLGSLLISSIQGRDLIVVQGVVAFMAIVVLVVNFAVDILYGILDPRTRVRAVSV